MGFDRSSAGDRERLCSFCRRPESAVGALIAGSGANICEECVALCVRVLREGDAPLLQVIEIYRRKVDDGWLVSQDQVVRAARDPAVTAARTRPQHHDSR